MGIRILLAAAIALLPASRLAAAEDAAGAWAAKVAGPKTVIIVYKTHFDIGYTAMAREVVHEYRTDMADRVLDAIERNRAQPKDRQFVWTLSGWPMHKILEDWPGQTPQRKQQIVQAFKDGRFVVHGLPFTTQRGARRLLLTPHIAGVTRQSSAFLFRSAWRNVARVLVEGEAPLHRAY